MAEKFGIKQLHEKKIVTTTAKDLKEYAKKNGLMDAAGKITEAGKEHLEYKHRKHDGAEYIAATEEFGRKMFKDMIEGLKEKYPNMSDSFWKH